MAWTFSGFAGPLEQDGRGWYWRKPVFTNDDPVRERCIHLKFPAPPGPVLLTAVIQRILAALNAAPTEPPHEMLRARVRAIVVANWAYINAHPNLRDALVAALEGDY